MLHPTPPPSAHPLTREPDAPPPDESRGDDYYRVLSEVMEDHAQRQERQRQASRRPESSRSQNMGIAAMIVGALSIYVWTAPPGFLQPEPYPEPSALEVNAGLRMDVYLQAQKIERFRRENDRLPATLEEAGEPEDGVIYERTGDASYRLVTTGGPEPVVYTAGEPLGEFLGDAESIILGGSS